MTNVGLQMLVLIDLLKDKLSEELQRHRLSPLAEARLQTYLNLVRQEIEEQSQIYTSDKD